MPRHYAFLKISEGCNHRCSFCIIPSMRGDLVNRDIGYVMAEEECLKNAGVRELLIISQDTSAYGVDIRFQYPSPKILKSMKRPAASENNLTRITRMN